MRSEDTGISRRGFLAGAATLAAVSAMGGLAGCSQTSSSTQTQGTTLKSADETIKTDVVVLGSGMAGLAAALEAASKGASVTLLEKASLCGGNTNSAEGVFGVGSSLQKKMGITISVQEILDAEYQFHNYNVNPKLWEQVASRSAENIDWLLGMGVNFETVTSPGDGQKTWHVYEGGHGSSAIKAMQAQAVKAGVNIRTETPATSLLINNGVISGVRAEANGKQIDVLAKSVVLATGGLAANVEQREARTNADTSKIGYWGATGMTGDGIQFAEAAGMGRAKHITVCMLGQSVAKIGITSELGVVGGQEPTNVWVNQDAERFIPESLVFKMSTASNALMQQTRVYSIMDKKQLDTIVSNGCVLGFGTFVPPSQPCTKVPDQLEKALANNPENVFTANTIEELAQKMSLDPKTLANTISTYNGYCAKKVDEEYEKLAPFLVPVQTPPFYGFRITTNCLNTLGGVRVNEKSQVIKEDGTVIPGLYAAGMECSGYSGETYGLNIPGSTQGIALCTGRIGGSEAATYALV